MKPEPVFDFAAWRQRLGWSVPQAAAGLGVSPQSVASWENGKAKRHSFATKNLCEGIEWFLTNPSEVTDVRQFCEINGLSYLASLEKFVNRGLAFVSRPVGRPRKTA